MTTDKKRKFIIDVMFIAIVSVLVYFVIEYLAVWILPFIIGLIVAILLQRPVGYLAEKTKLGRGFWSVLLVVLALLAIFGVIALAGWGIYSEAPGFALWLKGKAPEMVRSIQNVVAWISAVTEKLPEGINNAISDAPTKMVGSLVTLVADVIPAIGSSIITVAPGLLLSTVFSIVASCYITKDYRKIANFVISQLDSRKAELVIRTKQLFVTNILKMLRGYIIIMLITYFELFAGLLILRVDYAAVLAAFIAVLDILPVLGTGAVLIPWGIISLFMGNVWQGIGLLILYIVILVVRNIIEPRIIGQQVGLPPIVTLIAMYVGLKIFGVIGMMLLPIVIIILVKLQESGIIHIWNTPKDETKDDDSSIFRTARLRMKKKFGGATEKQTTKNK